VGTDGKNPHFAVLDAPGAFVGHLGVEYFA
jgi:hypothetical protein